MLVIGACSFSGSKTNIAAERSDFIFLESPLSGRVAVSSSPEDDFVLVPSNLPSDHSSDGSQGDKL